MLAFIIAFFGLVAGLTLTKRQRYPDGPWLRVSTKPGKLGQLDDHATFLRDSMAILRVGWERYSKHGVNYMLDTPEGPRYIVAQKYFDELVRAPDSHISALAAANNVRPHTSQLQLLPI
jgi:hypothetical protein